MIKSTVRRLYAVALLLALLIAAIKPVYAQVSELTLDNGLRIVTAESHAVPIVAVDVWVKAGTRRETPGQPGVAHFLEHLLFKGTPTHPDEESVDGAIEDLGGSLDAATSYDWAHFYTEVPSSGYQQAVSLLADILQHAALTTSSVEDERPIILDEVNRDNDDPLTKMEDSVRALVYSPTSAYSRSVTGSADDVRAVTRDEIAAFYSTYYVPNNVTVVISGDFDTADAQKLVSDEFGTWKRSTSLPADDSSQASSYLAASTNGPTIQKSLQQQDASESYLVMAFDAPSVSAKPDAWQMDVLLTLLGQGGNNRLTTNLKIKNHLVDTISADYLTQHDPGVLTISASMPTANVDAVQAAIIDQIQQLRTTLVTTSDVDEAKMALRSNYLFDVDTDSGHADSLGFYDCIDSYMYDVDYLNNISKVTPADVQQIAQKYLDPNAYAIVLQVPTPDVSTAKAGASEYTRTFIVDRVTTQ